jgi:hypothetical protein
MHKWPFFSVEKVPALRQSDQILIQSLESQLGKYSRAQEIGEILVAEQGKIYCSTINKLKNDIARDLSPELAG